MHKKSYITTTLSGPAVVTESLYEQLPSLSTTTIASEVPYISLDEFLADETTSTPSSSINEVKQTGEFPYFYCSSSSCFISLFFCTSVVQVGLLF